jgi:hypothetical protein
MAAATAPAAKLTDNGIHLNAAGYRAAAFALEDFLFGSEKSAGPAGSWRTSPAAEPLRQAILRKNEWFFHRSRPANMAYIFGFRKKEQGQNAVEVLKFESFIAAEEARIARLRPFDPTAATAVPEIPPASVTSSRNPSRSRSRPSPWTPPSKSRSGLKIPS